MPTVARSKTVDDLFRDVDSLLRSPQGKVEVARFNQLALDVVENLPTLRELRVRLRQRPSMQLYVNASNAKTSASRGRVELSVRVHGVECGTVTVGLNGTRPFKPKNRKLFAECGFDSAVKQQWESPAVARYISAAAEAIPDEPDALTPGVSIGAKVKGRPEARVEAALIRRMRQPGEDWRRAQQPVCLAGLPLQVPLPITASGAEAALGDGHIDVLARLGRGGKGLRVYEVKAPKADASGAMDQAVIYLATLKFMLAQGATAASWWRLIGFTSSPTRRITFEAFAFVADTLKNRKAVGAAMTRLNSANHHGVVLRVVFYQRPPGGALLIPSPEP